jgi:hypothetical protein
MLAEIVARLNLLEDALEEAHDKVCGCDDPGRHDWCIAQPRDLYALLNPETKPSSETWKRVAEMIGEGR